MFEIQKKILYVQKRKKLQNHYTMKFFLVLFLNETKSDIYQIIIIKFKIIKCKLQTLISLLSLKANGQRPNICVNAAH